MQEPANLINKKEKEDFYLTFSLAKVRKLKRIIIMKHFKVST